MGPGLARADKLSEPRGEKTPLRIVHVISSDERRGAQIFARDLVGALHEEGVEQFVLLLRNGKGGLDYEVRTAALAAHRLLPGVQVDPGAVWRLHRILRRWRPDVMQAHGGEALKYALPVAKVLRTPI